MGAKVTINIDPADKILLKRKLNKNGEAQRFFTHEVRRISDPYVPMKDGPLKNNVREEITRFVYVSPYARRQWYENSGNGLRGKMWVPRAWADRGPEVVRSVANYVGGRSG